MEQDRFIYDMQARLDALRAEVDELNRKVAELMLANPVEVNKSSLGGIMPSIGELRETFRKDNDSRSI